MALIDAYVVRTHAMISRLTPSSQAWIDAVKADFDAFLTIGLQQYKSKDTMDGLLAAFRTLANGKDVLQQKDMDDWLKAADAQFLHTRLVAGDDGLDYTPFTKSVYGDGAVPVL